MFLWFLPLLLLAVSPAAAPSGIPTVGQLLISTEKSVDPDLGKAVILLIHCDQQGIMGLIVNRRTDVPLSHVFPGLHGPASSQSVYFGGPVAMGARALVRSKRELDGGRRLFADVWVLDDIARIRTAAAGAVPEAFRVYAGYAGWSPAQLRNEVRLGLWKVLAGDVRIVFSSHPEFVWPLVSH